MHGSPKPCLRMHTAKAKKSGECRMSKLNSDFRKVHQEDEICEIREGVDLRVRVRGGGCAPKRASGDRHDSRGHAPQIYRRVQRPSKQGREGLMRGCSRGPVSRDAPTGESLRQVYCPLIAVNFKFLKPQCNWCIRQSRPRARGMEIFSQDLRLTKVNIP